MPSDGVLYDYCSNHAHGVCNWLVPTNTPEHLCEACALNRTIPNLSVEGHLLAWQKLEKAKHRLLYSLLKLGLPITPKTEDAEQGLAFDFLSDRQSNGSGNSVQTGHYKGLITINLAETDSVHREQIRRRMSEPYRTLIGHFRHEVGHYYWEQIIRPFPETLASYRTLFGDETQNYGQALEVYYAQGAPSGWEQRFISAYATAHPWEDWAETWTHYLHIMDMVETAFSFGLSIDPLISSSISNVEAVDFDPYQEGNFERILDAFVMTSLSVNSFNRGMGIPDVYPFVIPAAVKEKLDFIHRIIRQ